MRTYSLIICDVFNTVLFPPDDALHMAFIQNLISKVGLSNDVASYARIEWMLLGFNLSLLEYYSPLGMEQLIEHCLLNTVNEFSELCGGVAENKVTDFLVEYHDFLLRMYRIKNMGFLEQLSHQKSFLIFLSNANSFQARVSRSHIDDCFQILNSYELGSKKPSGHILEYVIQNADVGRDDVICVGDSLRSDIDPARSIGLDALLVVGEEQFKIDSSHD